MSKIQTKLVQKTAYVTTDGVEFSVEIHAERHQDYLDAKEKFLNRINMTERQFEYLWVDCSDYTGNMGGLV